MRFGVLGEAGSPGSAACGAAGDFGFGHHAGGDECADAALGQLGTVGAEALADLGGAWCVAGAVGQVVADAGALHSQRYGGSSGGLKAKGNDGNGEAEGCAGDFG